MAELTHRAAMTTKIAIIRAIKREIRRTVSDPATSPETARPEAIACGVKSIVM
jgi:hypothetical protein